LACKEFPHALAKEKQAANAEREPQADRPALFMLSPSGALREQPRDCSPQCSTLTFTDMKEKTYDLEERLLEYAANIIRVAERLPNTRAGNHVAGQLLRSGTSPLPNHGEAQAAESRNDFVHKLSICLKELRESHRWLRLARRVPLINPPTEFDSQLQETESLIKIFAKSIRTAQRNGRTPTSDVDVAR
jgi:four helix bundle protein